MTCHTDDFCWSKGKARQLLVLFFVIDFFLLLESPLLALKVSCSPFCIVSMLVADCWFDSARGRTNFKLNVFCFIILGFLSSFYLLLCFSFVFISKHGVLSLWPSESSFIDCYLKELYWRTSLFSLAVSCLLILSFLGFFGCCFW